MNLAKLSDRELRLEVEELLYDYVSALDEGELERWPEFFVSDCLYKIVSQENYERGLPLGTWLSESRDMLHDRVTALRGANVYAPRILRHLVSNVRVSRRDARELSAQANFTVLQTPLDGPTQIFLAGRYLDRIVVDEGRLKYKEKLCVYDTAQIPNSIVYPV